MKIIRPFLLFLMILFSLLAGSLIFVNRWLLPQKIRPFLVKALEEETGLVPEVRSLSFTPWKGFVLSGLRLSKPEQPEKPFLEANALSFKLLWVPFLLNKQVILSDLACDKPKFLLKRDAQGLWNVQSLFEKGGGTSNPPLISHLSIVDGTVEISDETSPLASSLTLTPLRVEVSFHLPDQMSFKGKTGLLDSPTLLVLDGTYSFIQKEFSFHLEARETTKELFKPYLGALPFTLTDARGTLRCDVSVDKNQTLSFQKIHYEGTLGLEQETWRSQGEAALDGFYTLWPKEPASPAGGPPDIDYFFTLFVKGARFESATLASPLEKLNGKFTLKEETLTFENLQATYAGQSLKAEGSLENFKEPLLTMQIQADADLTVLQSVPWSAPLLKYGRILSGRGAFQVSLKGPLGKDTALDYTADGRFDNASFKPDLLPQPVESVSGTFHFKPDQLLLEKVSGLYTKEPFRLEASVHGFQQPRVMLQLSYRGQDTTSQFDVKGEDLQPFRAAIKKADASFSFEGTVRHYEDPFLDGTLTLESSLDELTAFFPEAKEKIDRLGIKANMSSHLQIQGPLKQPENLTLEGTVQLPGLSIKQFYFQNVRAKLRYANQTLSLSEIVSQIYKGTLSGSLTWGFQDPSPFTIQVACKGIELEGFLSEVSPQLQKARGLLDGSLHLEGDGAHPQATVGNGAIAIREGNLYQAPILKNLFGVWKPILMILYPELDEWFTLKEASAKFFIANRTIQTNDLQIMGDRLTLYGKGKIGFDETLDARFLIRFTDPAIVERRNELSRLKNILVDETGMLAGEVRAKGTLSQPKFHYTSLPLSRLKNFFKGAADLILPGIFGEE